MEQGDVEVTPAALHEQHKARVLDTPRQHHDEATDALIVGALEAAVIAIHIGHGGVPDGQPSSACPKCDALTKIHLALRALGK